MFDGKMLRELAGIPMRRIDLAKSELALAEPDPLTLANLTTKSLTLWIAAIPDFDIVVIASELKVFVIPQRFWSSPPRKRGPRAAVRGACPPGSPRFRG